MAGQGLERGLCLGEFLLRIFTLSCGSNSKKSAGLEKGCLAEFIPIGLKVQYLGVILRIG